MIWCYLYVRFLIDNVVCENVGLIYYRFVYIMFYNKNMLIYIMNEMLVFFL